MLHEILANITIAIPQLPANDVLTLTVLNRLFPGIGGAVIEPLVTSQFACQLIETIEIDRDRNSVVFIVLRYNLSPRAPIRKRE